MLEPKYDICSNEDLRVKGDDASKLHLVVDLNRLGSSLFNVKMEYTYFAPRSGKNDLFEMTLVKWPSDLPMYWVVCSIPLEYLPQAEDMAKECGLRIANGVPLMLGGDAENHFPMNGPTVYTLENTPGHPVYNNVPSEIGRLKEEELAVCDAIINEDRRKYVEEMRSQGLAEEKIQAVMSQRDEPVEMYVPDGQHKVK